MSSELSENRTAGKAPASLSKDVIVAKAVELMAEHGLAGVSLRRVAAELGVSAPTLYWHIANKRELLDGIAERLLRGAVGTSTPAQGQAWWAWLQERARAMFEALIATPGAPEVMAGNRPTFDALSDTDASLGVLVAVGFPAGEAQQVFFAVGGYVMGMATEWQAEAAREREGVGVDEAVVAALRETDEYPNMSAALRQRTHVDPMATFDYGLSLLIGGIRARHEELTG